MLLFETASGRLIRTIGGLPNSVVHLAWSPDGSLLALGMSQTGGLRILHWGDNRHDPPEHVWDALGRIDIALLPVDGSQHVMSHAMTASIIARLKPRVVVPHHYYIWDLTQRASTLLPADGWVEDASRMAAVGDRVAAAQGREHAHPAARGARGGRLAHRRWVGARRARADSETTRRREEAL
jgi:hypothetical protein